MSDVTQILSAIEKGDAEAADKLLPLVYEELRKLATDRMSQEKPGHTLQATALVHEAYLRLIGRDKAQCWDSRGHFFAAAAEAMRRILIEAARRKKQSQREGGHRRVRLDEELLATHAPSDDLLDLDEALDRLESTDSVSAQLVKLRYFAGLTVQQAADTLGISLRSAERNWTYARTWLHRELAAGDGPLSD